MVSFIFPGQGSQSVGMGKALAQNFPAARRVFEEADEALSMLISRLCFDGSEEQLKRTEITQPAILTTSIAALRALQSERPDLAPRWVAGHSLGEITALVAAGALEFADAVRIVQARGRLMQEAVPIGEGAMAAVIGIEPDFVLEATQKVQEETGDIVAPANFNSTEQTVISGTKEGVEGARRALAARGVSKIVELPVSAPFHSPLMAPAARGLAQVLEPIELKKPRCPIITNVEAMPNDDVARIKPLLVEQVTAPVRWVEIVRWLVAQGETQAIEIGPGKVLMALARRIDRNLKVHNIEDPGSLSKTLEALRA